VRILIRGATVLPLQGGQDLLEGIDVSVEGGRIIGIGRQLPAPADVTLDGTDRLVIPGLVNAHVHSHNNYWRGWFDRAPLDHCVLHMWGVGADPATVRLTPRQVYARALLGCAEMLRTGTTTVVDDVNLNPALTEEHVAAVVRAYEDSGMRAVVAPHVYDIPYDQTLPFLGELLAPDVRNRLAAAPRPAVRDIVEVVEACARRWSGPERRVRFGIGPSGPQRCTDGLLTAMAELAARHDLPVYIHLLESRTQAVMGQVAYGQSLVERLASLGILGPRVSLGHCVWVTPADIATIAASGAVACHNPVSNVRIASGVSPVPDLVKAGVTVALGTDGVVGNDSLNMFEVMKLAALLQRIASPYPDQWLGARDVLGMAIHGGAASARLSTRGAVAVGERADLVLLDLRRATFGPRNDLVQQLVYAENGSSVETVLVDGRIVVDKGRVTTLDEAAVTAEVVRDAAAFHAGRQAGGQPAAELERYFHAMYERCWRTDVGMNRLGLGQPPEGSVR
jgi:cytosine/adenosine deaminase-related metal-dependent hydrolase